MTITLELRPEVERELEARAEARGVRVAEIVRELVERGAERTGQKLIDVCVQIRGLADDLDLARSSAAGRAVDLS